jgi:Outer membrane protein beta-barrel domain
MDLHYLNVPILFGYKPTPKLSMLVGPEIGYLIRTVRKPDSPNFDSPYEKLDYGLSIGSAYSVAKNTAIELRYTHGFDTLLKGFMRDANNNPAGVDRDGANRVFQLNVIYIF